MNRIENLACSALNVLKRRKNRRIVENFTVLSRIYALGFCHKT
jgi:hypothetical protein